MYIYDNQKFPDAWLVATSTDPLEDSDGERGEGEHVLLDYGELFRAMYL